MGAIGEIGGYFELELAKRTPYHANGLLFNSARNGLRYLVRQLEIEKIYVPAYTCPVVWAALEKENCQLEYYTLDSHFLPENAPPSHAWVLYTDYFGICSTQVETMIERYPNLILDLTQSFYNRPAMQNCVYSPRKYFGVPDGGIVTTTHEISAPLDRDISLERTGHLLKRIERGAQEAYNDFKRAEATLEDAPIRRMSKLTQCLLMNIDYAECARIRKANFVYLHKYLAPYNELTISVNSDTVPMAYPFLKKGYGARLKERLIENQIYIPTFWPGQRDDHFGKLLQQDLVPLPVDQRYGLREMEQILTVLQGCANIL